MRRLFGRAVGALLVGLLAMSIIGVAATETFVNKTGHDVYGIRVTFSTKVTIIRHDYVFPDQDPASGRSVEFTFSGGKLHKFKRFTIVWIPGTAEVVDYEWLEEEPTASSEVEETAPPQETSSSSAPSLPDPNTPPLLYGDDYPGPDEPLYQPKPDEEIWLTDLEGHEDIYDNDSIRINYAPGFDKSKVTKISVYRNGVYMRFLPEKFDVLTNAQMKTFDGNPMEHSPASSHTDHAIMGYEYEFDIYTADHLWILKKTVKSGFRWRPKEVWAQINQTWLGYMEQLSFDEIVAYFQMLKEDGFTGVSLDMNYYMTTPYDNEIFGLKRSDPTISIWNMRTPSLAELEEMLKAISKASLDAHVRGNIYISKKYQDEHGFAWSALIDPTNPKKFFDNYTQLWLKLVPLLNKYHVKLITPFTEMDGIEKYTTLIKEMYFKISDQFNNEIGFEESTHNILTGISPIVSAPIHTKTAFARLVQDFTFWDWKDLQGRPMRIEYSCWTPPLETQKDQRASVIARNFVKFWSIPVDYYRSKYSNNPQMFGEIGTYDADGVSLGPSFWDMTNKVKDEQEFADVWYSYLKGSKELDVDTINVWIFQVGDLYGNPTPDCGSLLIGFKRDENPAYRVIKAIIGPNTSTSE